MISDFLKNVNIFSESSDDALDYFEKLFTLREYSRGRIW